MQSEGMMMPPPNPIIGGGGGAVPQQPLHHYQQDGYGPSGQGVGLSSGWCLVRIPRDAFFASFIFLYSTK